MSATTEVTNAGCPIVAPRKFGGGNIAKLGNSWLFEQDPSAFTYSPDLSTATVTTDGLGAYGSIQLSFTASGPVQNLCSTGDPSLRQEREGSTGVMVDFHSRSANVGSVSLSTGFDPATLVVDHGCPPRPPSPPVSSCPWAVTLAGGDGSTSFEAGTDQIGNGREALFTSKAIHGLPRPASLGASVVIETGSSYVTVSKGPVVHLTVPPDSSARGQADFVSSGDPTSAGPFECGHDPYMTRTFDGELSSPSDPSLQALTFATDALIIRVPRSPAGLSGQVVQIRYL